MQSVLEANQEHTVGMPDKPPTFFIPGCPPEDQEKLYAAMAKDCENVAVPAIGQRIYAISYRHNGDVWFATVGQTQTGKRPIWKSGKKTEEMMNIEDPNLVLAIFPFTTHDLCWVYTSGGPFIAGEVGRTDRFSVD
jgi:hypothetical protein